MKNKFYIIVCLLLAGLTSCNSWLDVKPETESALDEMFSKQQGFQDALIGSYLKFKVDGAYGKHMVFGNIEFLAQHWDFTSESLEEDLSRYNYKAEGVEGVFSEMYLSLYRTVAELDMILENIDGARSVFEEGMYEIIKGEALAMRAYCHLDILRIFGPMPSKVSGDPILPYVRKTSLQYHPHQSYADYTKFLEEDLLEAEKLLKGYDPIINTVETGNLSISAQDFLKNRQIRFNYYNVKAIQARFYLWLGGDENKAKAYACAKEIMAAKSKTGMPMFRLGNSNDITAKDYSFSTEHILSVYDFKLYEKAQNAFTQKVQYKKEQDLVKTELFPGGTTDIRSFLWSEEIASNAARSYTIKKFLQKEERANNQLPLIRLSEIYFIAMECAPLEETNRLLEEFCVSRDIPVVSVVDKDALKDVLVEQYNREFYGEGQAFYAFKRLNVKDIMWAMDEGNEDSYVVPLPREELSFNK